MKKILTWALSKIRPRRRLTWVPINPIRTEDIFSPSVFATAMAAHRMAMSMSQPRLNIDQRRASGMIIAGERGPEYVTLGGHEIAMYRAGSLPKGTAILSHPDALRDLSAMMPTPTTEHIARINKAFEARKTILQPARNAGKTSQIPQGHYRLMDRISDSLNENPEA